MGQDESIMKLLEGRFLSSIEFVSTYIQLRFDGPQLNVINFPQISPDGSHWIKHDEKEFYYFLIRCIGSNVQNVKFEIDNVFEIWFDNNFGFKVSLKEDNYQTNSAEALLFWDEQGNLVAV